MNRKKEKFLITAALPYANGPLHIGHAVGAYIPADIYARFRRMTGCDVVFVCGTDEHGTPIAVTAEKEGVKPQQVVDKYHGIISKAFSDLGISFDNFSRTTIEIHYKLSQEFFLKILEKGYIYKKTVTRPYCPNCRRFLPDRYVRGICPKCESRDERGDQCEACGKQLEPQELKKPYCIICKTTPQMKETAHWFFKLSQFSGQLREWVEENTHWPSNARNFALGWIKEGLEDRSITRDLDWGVPVPLAGAEGKVLYVWFDAPIGYISATMEWAQKNNKPDEWKKYWVEKDCRIVHFLGKDNIPFHTIIWPATLMAHSGFNLPWQIASNEYLNLAGRKMSTSRGWVLWLHDCLQYFQSDLLRYALIANNPEKHDADFSLEDFQERVNGELVATLGNFIHRTLTFIQQKKNSTVPSPGKFDAEDERIMKVIEDAPKRVADKIDKLQLMDGLKEVMSTAQAGNEYFQHKEPWKNQNDTTLYLCANLVRTLSVVMAPYLPHSAEDVWRMLNMKGSVHEQDWYSKGKIEGGHKVGKVEPLYRKIEDSEIKAFEDKFLNLSKLGLTEENKMESKKEDQDKGKTESTADTPKETAHVSFSEFARMDLRVGVIREVGDHPNADKLYLLKIDLGDRVVQSAAGLKGNYLRENLVGRKVVVFANLKPVKIRGVNSEAMILAAVDGGGNPIILVPEKDVEVGAKIK